MHVQFDRMVMKVVLPYHNCNAVCCSGPVLAIADGGARAPHHETSAARAHAPGRGEGGTAAAHAPAAEGTVTATSRAPDTSGYTVHTKTSCWLLSKKRPE